MPTYCIETDCTFEYRYLIDAPDEETARALIGETDFQQRCVGEIVTKIWAVTPEEITEGNLASEKSWGNV